MKTKSKTIFGKALMISAGLVIGLLLSCTISVKAQMIDPGGDVDEPAPVDGGITIAIAAGIGYGLKKMKEMRKQ